MEPMPVFAMVIWPGRLFAACTRSFSVCTGLSVRTAIDIGMSPTMATEAKSLVGL